MFAFQIPTVNVFLVLKVIHLYKNKYLAQQEIRNKNVMQLFVVHKNEKVPTDDNGSSVIWNDWSVWLILTI